MKAWVGMGISQEVPPWNIWGFTEESYKPVPAKAPWILIGQSSESQRVVSHTVW